MPFALILYIKKNKALNYKFFIDYAGGMNFRRCINLESFIVQFKGFKY